MNVPQGQPDGAPSTTSAQVTSDNALHQAEHDRFGRWPVAESFARYVLRLDRSEGTVVAVLGAWGAGKTTFINFARHTLEKHGATVVDFNPWMFGGAEQLVELFFTEIAAQLKLKNNERLKALADALKDYGDSLSGLSWLPVVGPWVPRMIALLRVLASSREGDKGATARRAELTEAMASLPRPIVVILDDIDRLSSDDIRHVFKLVRLTASFPNVIYVLAFERQRIEAALQDQGMPGRRYLEKIIQYAIDLPDVPREILDRETFSAIDAALADDDAGPFHQDTWPDIYAEVIRPQIRNMRDVRRYATAIKGTVSDLSGQVASADWLALEAIRVFTPDIFDLLRNAADGLTTPVARDYSEPPSRLRDPVLALVEASADQEGVVHALVERLFPVGARYLGRPEYGSDWLNGWLVSRRVAHGDILRLYFERVIGKNLTSLNRAENALRLMRDESQVSDFLGSVEPDSLEDVISALEVFEKEFDSELVVPGTIALMNVLPAIPMRPRGMWEFDPSTAVRRVVFRLLRTPNEPAVVESFVEEILPRIRRLSGRLIVIKMVGFRKDVGHALVSEAAAERFENEWVEQMRRTPVADLVRETDLLWLLLCAQSWLGEGTPLEVPDVPEVTSAILHSARSEALSQPFESRAVKRQPRLAWKAMVQLFGSAEELSRRLTALRERMPLSPDLAELVAKYESGWEPDRFDSE